MKSTWKMPLAIDLIGWDIGGAHLKAAGIAENEVVSVIQRPCPLWLGLDHFHSTAEAILQEMAPAPGCVHAVTMTGELADLFSNRAEGVFGLLRALSKHVPMERIQVFTGPTGFKMAKSVLPQDIRAIASANWQALAFHAASAVPDGLLVDIGSTTADLLVLSGGKVLTRGYTDFERLHYGELVYCGVARTPLMALAQSAPFEGEWIGLMAEHFATTADIYRLSGELPEYADQTPAADGGEKCVEASARRIARMLGRDVESANDEAWKRLAGYFRERQLARLMDACLRQLSRGLLSSHAPFIGSGVGRFLVQELAHRIGFSYLDYADLFPMHSATSVFHIADCAPAVAVAYLARQNHA